MILSRLSKKLSVNRGKKISDIIIDFYQAYISPDTGFLKRIGLIQRPVCVFYPSCSEYMRISINRYGYRKGIKLGVRRILRCHPWQKNHFDPVP